MAELVTVKLEEILVDPARFAVREPWYDAGHVEQMVEDLEAGCELPPLRVAVAANLLADWYSNPRVTTRNAERSQWRLAQRQVAATLPDERWACWPIKPAAVLIDGYHRYAALVTAGRKTATVVFDPTPVQTAQEAFARACQANCRNARAMTDGDKLCAFIRLWLGRPARESHERWRPEPGAMPLDEIATVFGKSPAWCSAMCRYAEVAQAIGLRLGLGKARELARLPGESWYSFVWHQAGGEPALRQYTMVDGEGQAERWTGYRTVLQMTLEQLRRVVDQRLEQLDAVAEAPAPTDQPGQLDEAPSENGQYLMVFEEPERWWADDAAVDRVYGLAANLAPQIAYDQALAMMPHVQRVNAALRKLAAQANRGGYQVAVP